MPRNNQLVYAGETRPCSKCGEPHSRLLKAEPRRFQSYCKPCQAKESRAWERRNKAKAKPQVSP
jgi:hypothetical protein